MRVSSLLSILRDNNLNKTLLGILLIVVVIALAATFLLPARLGYQTVQSASASGIRYDSRAGTPVYKRKETAQAPLKEFTASMEFMPYSTKGYTDLFGTAPFNKGIRVEVSGETSALVVGAKNANGWDPYVISRINKTTSQPSAVKIVNTPHRLAITIDRTKHVSISLDGNEIVNMDSPDLNYDISDITVGSGFSPARTFNGRITNFSYSYGFYAPRVISGTVWLWARLVLFFLLIALLYLLLRDLLLTSGPEELPV